VSEILDALGVTVDERNSAGTDLELRVTGNFSGPVAQVIARVLEKYDYVAAVSQSGVIEIVWIRPSAASGGSAAGGGATITPGQRPAVESAIAAAQTMKPRELVLSPQVRRMMAERAERLKKRIRQR
jgi:hypothetical protein